MPEETEINKEDELVKEETELNELQQKIKDKENEDYQNYLLQKVFLLI